jgi:mannose-6-phosphate isomerase
MELYPLKFHPIYKERIWGGNKLEVLFGRDIGGKVNIGESWDLSAVEGDISVVSNGPLAGNDLQELIEVYMGDLVGEKIFEEFGAEFPLLIKLIDANDDLSIQVHPDNETAEERHGSYGKTEMWVALDDSETPKLISGFNCNTNKKEFLERLNNNTLTDIFHYEEVKTGDVFFVPAGRVHAICSGNLIAEIQQTSDVTYRIFDYNRKDKEGNSRDLHLDLSLDVIDYSQVKEAKTSIEPQLNKLVELVSCEFFTTNKLMLDKTLVRDYYKYDSFVILMCVNGECLIGKPNKNKETLRRGDTILIPASLNNIEIIPVNGKAELLEVYIK